MTPDLVLYGNPAEHGAPTVALMCFPGTVNPERDAARLFAHLEKYLHPATFDELTLLFRPITADDFTKTQPIGG